MATTMEMYEEIGDLYYRETCHLCPGKSDPLRDTNTKENEQRFLEWYRLKSMECAIDRILELKKDLEELEERLDDITIERDDLRNMADSGD